MEKEKDTRYPYTYACDYIRSLAGYAKGGTKLSRGEASRIRSAIAFIVGVDDRVMAEKLADYYLAHEHEITEGQVSEAMSKIFGNQCVPSDDTFKLVKDKE